MTRTMLWGWMAAALLAGVASEVVGQETPTSNYEHLKFLESRIGTWVGEAEVFMGPTPAKLEVRFTVGWVMNKNFLEQQVKAGPFEMKTTTGWDRSRGQIWLWGVSSDGGRWELAKSVSEPDGREVWEGTAFAPDGTKTSKRDVYKLSGESMIGEAYIGDKLIYKVNVQRKEGSPSQQAVTLDEDAAKEDLAKLQGEWESQGSTIRNVKTVQGNQETITRYNQEGAVVRAHTTTIDLRVKDGIRLFTFSGIEVTEGPQKGLKWPMAGGYIYKIDGDVLYEIRGAIGDGLDGEPRVVTWTRVKQ